MDNPIINTIFHNNPIINSYYGINCMDDSALANESHGFVLTMAHIFRLTFLSDKPDHKPHPMTYQKNGWEETVRKRSCTVSHSHYAITLYSYIYICVCVIPFYPMMFRFIPSHVVSFPIPSILHIFLAEIPVLRFP